jgi:hypothetical protein
MLTFASKNITMRCIMFIVLGCLIWTVSSCGQKGPEIKYPGQIEVKQMIGYYANTLPYPNTPGEFTEIQFYQDSTFLIYQTIIGRDSVPRGTFGRWVDLGRMIQLDLMRGDTMNLLYNGKDMLLLDKNQGVIADDAKYALFRQPNVSINLQKKFQVIAKYEYAEGAAAIHMCNIGHTFPVMNIDGFEQAIKVFEARTNKEKDFFLEMIIHVEELPMMTNSATIYLAIDSVIGQVNIDACPD